MGCGGPRYLNDDEDYTPSATALRALAELQSACPHINLGRRARAQGRGTAGFGFVSVTAPSNHSRAPDPPPPLPFVIENSTVRPV